MAELEVEWGKRMPTFTHYLDLPVYALIVALGTLKPNTWSLFVTGAVFAVLMAGVLTQWIPHLYPGGDELAQSTASPSFNADADTGHAFSILRACVGTLRASRSGAG